MPHFTLPKSCVMLMPLGSVEEARQRRQKARGLSTIFKSHDAKVAGGGAGACCCSGIVQLFHSRRGRSLAQLPRRFGAEPLKQRGNRPRMLGSLVSLTLAGQRCRSK